MPEPPHIDGFERTSTVPVTAEETNDGGGTRTSTIQTLEQALHAPSRGVRRRAERDQATRLEPTPVPPKGDA